MIKSIMTSSVVTVSSMFTLSIDCHTDRVHVLSQAKGSGVCMRAGAFGRASGGGAIEPDDRPMDSVAEGVGECAKLVRRLVASAMVEMPA